MNVKEMIQAGARIIDVRSVDEYRDGAYPGAENIPVHLMPARLPELGPKSQQIVVYCASGARSAMAARLLKEAGYDQVLNAGGLADLP